MLAGRKIGQVQELYSPGPPRRNTAQEAEAAIHPAESNAAPDSDAEQTEIRSARRVQVARARVYRDAKRA
jgi:hypothetical protein